MRLLKTDRGFLRGEFMDEYGAKCSIQESSLAEKACIWLGVNEVIPQVLVHGEGWKTVPIPSDSLISGRMHLSQKAVKMLLPILECFAKTGNLPRRRKSLKVSSVQKEGK